MRWLRRIGIGVLVLVVGAALLIRTLVALQAVDMGFNSERLLTAAVAPPRGQYRDPEALRQLFTQLLERASAIPGVRSTESFVYLKLKKQTYMWGTR